MVNNQDIAGRDADVLLQEVEMRCKSCRSLVRLSRLLPVVLLFAACLKGQQTPAMGLVRNEDLPLARRVLVAPIALFQQVSYATPLLDCLFEPSCSQYMAEAVVRHGALPGVIIGADRLVRCNPWAFHYHLRDHPEPFHIDGRMLDPVPQERKLWEWKKAGALAIVPGLGRVRAGRPGDGIVSLLMVASLSTSAYRLHLDGKQIRAGFLGALSIIFWLADIRSAATDTYGNTSEFSPE